MSSHPVSVPSGLTRGYSNAYADTRINLHRSIEHEISDNMDILDAQQVEGGM